MSSNLVPPWARTLTAGQVHGLRFASTVVLAPLRVSRKTEFPMLKMMGIDRAYAWTRFLILLVPSLIFIAFIAMLFVRFGGIQLLLGWLAVNEASGRAWKPISKPKTTTRRGLQKLMVQEELVKVKDGQKPPKLVIVNKSEDQYITRLRVRAMGTTVTDWQKKKHTIAVRANLPLSMVEVEEDHDAPPHEFDIVLIKKGGRKTMKATLPQSTEFTDEFRLGRTLAGREIRAWSYETNTLIVGMMGYGKSVVTRRFIAHCLLDPEGDVYIADGKGSKEDYQDALAAISTYIGIGDEDACEALEDMFDRLLAEADECNRNGTRKKRLLVLEEWQRFSKAGSKDYQKRITQKLRDLYKVGRSTGLHVLLITQRPSAVAIDTELRDLFSQVIVFKSKGASQRMALGETVEVSKPRRKGEAIFSNDEEEAVFVLIDEMTKEVWLDTVSRMSPRESVRLTRAAHEPSPLAQATHAAAQRLTGESVRPGVLYEALPVDIRPSTVSHYGRWLTGLGLEKRSEQYLLAEVIEATGGN